MVLDNYRNERIWQNSRFATLWFSWGILNIMSILFASVGILDWCTLNLIAMDNHVLYQNRRTKLWDAIKWVKLIMMYVQLKTGRLVSGLLELHLRIPFSEPVCWLIGRIDMSPPAVTTQYIEWYYAVKCMVTGESTSLSPLVNYQNLQRWVKGVNHNNLLLRCLIFCSNPKILMCLPQIAKCKLFWNFRPSRRRTSPRSSVYLIWVGCCEKIWTYSELKPSRGLHARHSFASRSVSAWLVGLPWFVRLFLPLNIPASLATECVEGMAVSTLLNLFCCQTDRAHNCRARKSVYRHNANPEILGLLLKPKGCPRDTTSNLAHQQLKSERLCLWSSDRNSHHYYQHCFLSVDYLCYCSSYRDFSVKIFFSKESGDCHWRHVHVYLYLWLYLRKILQCCALCFCLYPFSK